MKGETSWPFCERETGHGECWRDEASGAQLHSTRNKSILMPDPNSSLDAMGGWRGRDFSIRIPTPLIHPHLPIFGLVRSRSSFSSAMATDRVGDTFVFAFPFAFALRNPGRIVFLVVSDTRSGN